MNGYGSTSEEVTNLVDRLQLVDLSLFGASYSYFGNGQVIARSRLNWFLIFNSSMGWSSRVTQLVIQHHVSCHIPIMLSMGNFSPGRRPFQFFNIWCQDKNLGNLVTSTWECYRSSSGSFWGNLELTRSRVFRWQRNKYRSSQNQISACEEELGSLNNNQPPSSEEDLLEFTNKRSELMAKHTHLRSIEDSCWIRKSKIQWRKKGNQNTFFFHIITMA